MVNRNMFSNNFVGSAVTVLLILIGIAFFQFSQADDRISIGIGDANEDIDIFRIGLQRDFAKSWLQDRSWGISGFWELSASHWDSDDANDSIDAVAFSPVFVYSPNRTTGFKPYIDVGIGIALISAQELGDRDLSSTFQFEDRIGIGARFGNKQQHDLNFRFLHYSNLGFSSPNDGIDIYMLSYAYAFSS